MSLQVKVVRAVQIRVWQCFRSAMFQPQIVISIGDAIEISLFAGAAQVLSQMFKVDLQRRRSEYLEQSLPAWFGTRFVLESRPDDRFAFEQSLLVLFRPLLSVSLCRLT